jgi:diguanylate cyclase (GGDEF)-like protein
MSGEQLLATALAALLIANTSMLAVTPLRIRGGRRSWWHGSGRPNPPDRKSIALARSPTDGPTRPPNGPSGVEDPSAEPDGRSAAAIEAFVASIAPDGAGRARRHAPSRGTASQPGANVTAARMSTAAPTPARHLDAPGWRPTGLAGPGPWDEVVREESARVARFGRASTVVMAELPHLDDVADRLGRELADRLAAETARLLLTKGRAADRVAWLGDARFAVLLVETGESGARSYVDRMRAVGDAWLGSAGLSIRLSLGWANPAALQPSSVYPWPTGDEAHSTAPTTREGPLLRNPDRA